MTLAATRGMECEARGPHITDHIFGRLLNMGATPAAMNMAVDEAILFSQKEQPNPTLRFLYMVVPSVQFRLFSRYCLRS